MPVEKYWRRLPCGSVQELRSTATASSLGSPRSFDMGDSLNFSSTASVPPSELQGTTVRWAPQYRSHAQAVSRSRLRAPASCGRSWLPPLGTSLLESIPRKTASSTGSIGCAGFRPTSGYGLFVNDSCVSSTVAFPGADHFQHETSNH